MAERARIGGPKIPGGLDLEEPWLVRKDSGSRRREKEEYFFCSLAAAELYLTHTFFIASSVFVQFS